MPAGVLIASEGARKESPVAATVFRYDADAVEECVLGDEAHLAALRARGGVLWIDVNGVHDTGILERIGAAFNIHALVLEDIADTAERPKVDDYEDYLYVTLKTVRPSEESPGFDSEQMSFVLGKGYLISFQERETDPFDPVRARLRGAKGRIRRMGPDFLLYALIDSIVDGYFTVIEDLGDDLEEIEDRLIQNPAQETFHAIHGARQVALNLRRCVWPMREMLAVLARNDTDLVETSTKMYLRDVYDHAVEILDVIENSRDVCSSLLDVYLSSQSNRLNEVMKVLTVIATIFMPLSWIVGLYGMNFEYMPELKLHYGYPASLAIMGAIAVWMLLVFRRKGWI